MGIGRGIIVAYNFVYKKWFFCKQYITHGIGVWDRSQDLRTERSILRPEKPSLPNKITVGKKFTMKYYSLDSIRALFSPWPNFWLDSPENL